MIYLDELPYDHELRRKPLVNSWYRFKDSQAYRQVKPAFKIASNTYNDLSERWTEHYKFTFQKEET